MEPQAAHDTLGLDVVETDPLSSGLQLQSCPQQNPDSDWPRAALPFFSQSALLWRDSLYLPVLSPAARREERPARFSIHFPASAHRDPRADGIQPNLLLKVPQGPRDLKTKALGSGPIVKSLGSKKVTASSANVERVFQNF